MLQLVAPAGAGPQTPSTPVVRLAAAIYLKNRIRSSWKPLPSDPSSSLLQPATRTTSQPSVPIPPSDRQSLKTNLIPLYAALSADSVENSAKVKEQVGEALAKVIECEFPHEWPGLVQEIQGMLGATYQPGDGNGNVEAGLRATAEVFNTMRYAARDETGEILVNLATHLLPLLLPLANQILSPASSPPSTPQALAHQGTLLRLILKSYKNSIIHTLTPAHQAHEAIVPWGTLLLQIVSHPLDPSLLPSAIDDPDLLEKHPWSRTKKWACWSLNRLFTRYGCPTSLPKNLVKQYGPFAERFVAQFAPEIFKTYLAAVEKMVRGEWFPKKGKYHILCFFEEWCVRPSSHNKPDTGGGTDSRPHPRSINPKSMFALLKPHLSTLIEHFIFPLVCLTEDEIEMFNEDPAEYARQFFGGAFQALKP